MCLVKNPLLFLALNIPPPEGENDLAVPNQQNHVAAQPRPLRTHFQNNLADVPAGLHPRMCL